MKSSVLLLLGLVVAFIAYRMLATGDVSQQEIQDLSFVEGKQKGGDLASSDSVFKEFKGLPYPHISRGFQKLTKGELPKPIKDLVSPNGPSSFTRFRHLDTPSTMSKERQYLPDYYRKDTMDPDDTQASEMRPFIAEDEEGDVAWTDDNVSEHPKFYSSTMKRDELTNVGGFFDKDNQYNDTTSCNTFALPSDNCYIDKQGSKFCMDNTRLQVVPPALITDPQDNYALNSLGMYKDYNRVPVNDHRTMNGGPFGNIFPSKPLGMNESPAKPIGRQYGRCDA
jgi:hypothetical protein